ncbi:MAG TPA: T9SS type A sorting domain-containing protein, partial [Candidatus Marinimicrobia bacterium]|nr:T9SS type A sorting domain-containing protein [Candidatus Neomarinimicrobiota bacterium]
GNDIQHIYSVDSLSGSYKQQDFYNLTINNTGATDTVVMGGDFDIKNNLTLESGTIDLEDVDPSIQIKGNLTISDGVVWIKGNKPLIFNGSTQFSDTNLQVSNLGRVEVMDSLFIFTDMAVDNLFIPSTGTFGHTPSLALYNRGDLVVNEEGVFDSDSISITFNGDTTQTISGVNNFYSLYIKSCDSCVVELSDTNDVIFVTNGVSIETGRLNLPYSSNLESLTINEKGTLQSGDLIQLTGSWSNDGAFLHNNGKVIFKGVNQSINGNTDFYELTKETSVADTLTFEKETLQTIASKIDLIGGNVNNRLVLRSNSDDLSPIPFQLALTQDGLQTLEYLRIKDGNVSTGDTLVCLYSQDAGGNSGWVFVNSAPVISFPDEVLSYSEHDTLKLFGENEIITVSDLNDDSLSSAIVRISTNYYSTEDTLLFTEQNGITVDTTWGENGFSDSTGTLKLIGDDSLAVWAFVLKNVHYLNLSDNPMEEDRTIEISVNDGEKESAPFDRIIQVTNVNDPLFITSQDSIYATEGIYFQYLGTASDPDDNLFTWNFHSFPSWMVTNGDSIYGIPPNYTRDTTFTAISSDGEFFDTLLVNVFIAQINKPHPAVAVVQNNAFSNHFEFVVVDTMAKVIEEPRLTVSSTIDEEVSLTTIADFTFGGHHYFETIPGIFAINVEAEGDVGDTSISRIFNIAVAKANAPWVGFSPDSLLRINGTEGTVRSDKLVLVVDSTLFSIIFRDRASYRIGNESMIFEKAVTVSIQSSDDLAIYRMEGDTWIELPSMSMNGQIIAYTKKMGYFRLGAKTMIIPEISSLHQNYPNPFNPVTTIMYDVGFLQGPNQKINISVYNILGQHITTLVDKYHEIGRHSIRWDSRDKWTKPVASGMYLVYMRSESGFVQTKKITVLK